MDAEGKLNPATAPMAPDPAARPPLPLRGLRSRCAAGGPPGDARVEGLGIQALARKDVYADVDRRARAAGWDAVAKDRDGRTSQWAKAYPDWSRGGLSIERLNPEKAAAPGRYSLIGSI